MIAATRGSMIARLCALVAVGLVTMGAQSSCSSGDGADTVRLDDPGPVISTRSGATFSVTLALKDSSGQATNRFARAELITFELTVLNRTNAPIRLQLPTMGGNQDFQVFKPGAADAQWDWAANKSFLTVVTDVTFEPGRPQVFTGTWDQVKLDGAMLEPGSYEAQGQFFYIPGQTPALSEDDTRAPRVAFMVN